jgi:3'(2'), 5'-bisphosphate nucleotidase
MACAPEILRLAALAVQEAGVLCARLQHELGGAGGGGATPKQDGSPVTVADYAAQALITRALIGAKIDGPIAGEEQAEALRADRPLLEAVTAAIRRASDWTDATNQDVLSMIGHQAWREDRLPSRVWVLDPIDGTKGFIAQRHFAVCLALIENGRPIVAALACPNLALDVTIEPGPLDASRRGCIVAASSDSPVMHMPMREADGSASTMPLVEVPAVAGPTRRQPILTFSVEASEGRVRDFEAMADEMQRRFGRRPVALPMDSQAKYAIVARGQADIYDRPPRRTREKSWDHAAGCLLLERAGCTVTDSRGRPIDWSRLTLGLAEGILGARQPLHDQVLASRRMIGLV